LWVFYCPFVTNPVFTLLIHPFLLAVYFTDDKQILIFRIAQKKKRTAFAKFFYRLQIPFQISELFADYFAPLAFGQSFAFCGR